jgi:hypothetical protein
MAGGVSITTMTKSRWIGFSLLRAEPQFSIDLLDFQKVVGVNIDGIGQQPEVGPDFDKEFADVRLFINQEPVSCKPKAVEIDSQGC